MSDSTKYTSKLSAARILVIGGSSGIGFAVAEACVEHGAVVVIASSNPQRVDTAVDKIKTAYPSKSRNIHGLTVDLSQPTTLEKELGNVLSSTVQKISSNGKIDHVVFTAADALAITPLSAISYEDIVKAGQIRFVAPLLLAKLLPTYLEQTYCSSYVLTTGSISEKPMKDWSVIAGYAAGLHAMVRNLALDLRPIRVNGVSPGVVDTELWRVTKEQREEMMRTLGEKLATGRAGQPEDVAQSYLALLQDRNMTGGMVRTDGGWLFM